MVNLLSLSNELLVNVFSSCDTIQSAASYLMCKIALARRHPEAQLNQALYSTLTALPHDFLLTISGIYLALEAAHKKYRENLDEARDIRRELNREWKRKRLGCVLAEHWQHVVEVIITVMDDKSYGRTEVEGILSGADKFSF